ncbi:MAG: ATP-binding protein [Bacteroidia bacterium]
MEKHYNSKASILRQKAGEWLKNQSVGNLGSELDNETMRLLHELEAYQIELEMINDELVQAKDREAVAAKKYMELYDLAPTGYVSLSPDGEIIQLNVMGAKMLGKERSLLLNRRFAVYISEDSKQVYHEFHKKLKTSNVQETCELSLTAPDGSASYFQLSGIATSNKEQYLITMYDISKRKLAQESLSLSEKKMEDIIFCVGDRVWETDENGIYTSSVNKGINHFGYQDDEIVGKSMFDFMLPEEAKKNRAIFSEIAANKLNIKDLENWHIQKDGINLCLLTNGIPILDKNGNLKGYRGVDKDVSERMQAEHDLLLAKEKAEKGDKLKSAFLSNMSHEIRTPMNGILGFTQLLKSPDLAATELQDYIRIIEKSGARLLSIINDIMDISKIESGMMKIDISKSNVNEQTEYIYTFFKQETERKGLQFRFKNTLPANEASIYTDREKLFAILTNLVKNAIKYTDEGSIEFGYVSTFRQAQGGAGSTTASVSAVGELVEPELEFFVKDTGIGIRSDRQQAIFERFYQADTSDSRAYQGAGLGLSIAKAYVEMLGGEIRVESEYEKGSSFYFTLPYPGKLAEQSTTPKKTSVNASINPVKELKILIAEDDETSKLLLNLSLKSIGKEVITVATGIEAIEVCRNNPDIDLVLMDIQMPVMDGYEATRQIRQFNKKIIIIAQTAFGLSDDPDKAAEAGCNDYLLKPIIKGQLQSVIEKYF